MWLLLRLETFAGGSVPANINRRTRRAPRATRLGVRRSHRLVRRRSRSACRRGRVYAACGRPSLLGNALAAFRLTGRCRATRRDLRWLYGLVADPYPLEIRQPDGSATIEWIHGTNWSGMIDLTRSFTRPTRSEIARQYLWLGYTHILPKGLDHILFVLGIFLLSPRLKTMLLQVTAFTDRPLDHARPLDLRHRLPALAHRRAADRAVDRIRGDRKPGDARVEAVAARARVHVRLAARPGICRRAAGARPAAR